MSSALDDGSCSRSTAEAALDTLELLAEVAADLNSFAESARLLGAASADLSLCGAVRSPLDQRRYDATVAALRASLGGDALDAALAEGTRMTLDQAVAYAARGRGERRRPSSGWESLTPAELDVVRLVAGGATNRQVADALCISANTVKVHLAHIFAKLGVSTRAELAARSARRAGR